MGLPVTIDNPLKGEKQLWLYDESRIIEKEKSRGSSSLLIAAYLAQIILYAAAYIIYRNRWKHLLDKKMDYVKEMHNFYVDIYDVQKDYIYTFVSNLETYPVDLSKMQPVIDGMDLTQVGFNKELDLYNKIYKTKQFKGTRIKSAERATRTLNYQRRLRDTEFFNLQYELFIIDSKSKFFKLGSTEETQMMSHITNAVNITKGFVDIASKGVTSGLMGLSYETSKSIDAPQPQDVTFKPRSYSFDYGKV